MQQGQESELLACLPSPATLHSSPLETDLLSIPERYGTNHRDYLNHPTYRKYLLMHKICLGRKGADDLEAVAGILSQEVDPLFLSAAASAYLEAGIIRCDDASAEQKCQLADSAEALWEKALYYEDWLEEREIGNGSPQDVDDITEPYRIATNLACLPMVRSLFEGDVRREAIDESIESLLNLGSLTTKQLDIAEREGLYRNAAQYTGFYHEINTLIALLYRRDPKFIAIPSFHRADTGYFYPEQTHDIELISQHYGTVRTILPIEVKARIERRSRRRYRSLIIGGQAHLQLSEWLDPNITRTAYQNAFEGEPCDADAYIVNSTQLAISSLLARYKKSGRYKPLNRHNSRTTYYSGSSQVAS